MGTHEPAASSDPPGGLQNIFASFRLKRLASYGSRPGNSASPAYTGYAALTESLMHLHAQEGERSNADGIVQKDAWRLRETDGSMVAERNSEPDYTSVANFDDVENYDFCLTPDLYESYGDLELFGAGYWDTTYIDALQMRSMDEDLAIITSATGADCWEPKGPRKLHLPMRSFEPLPSILPNSQPRRLDSIPSLTDDTSESIHTPPLAQRAVCEDLAVPPDCPSPRYEMLGWPSSLPVNEEENPSSTDEEDASTSDASDDVRTLADDHPLRTVIPEISRITLLAYRAWKQHTSSTDNCSRNAERSSRPSQNLDSEPVDRGSKRPRVSNNSSDRKNDREDDDGDPRPPKRQEKGKEKLSDEGPLFACPFYRNNPILHKDCIQKTLRRFCDVRYHLQSHHAQPRYCGSCKVSMSSEATWLEHQEARTCKVNPGAPIPIGWNQELQGKIKAATPRGTKDDQKWQIVYKTMFPSDGRTMSPWIHKGFTHEQEELRAFIQSQRSSKAMRGAMRRRGLLGDSISEDDADALWHEVYVTSIDAIIEEFLNRSSTPSSLQDTSGSSPSADQRTESIPEDQNVSKMTPEASALVESRIIGFDDEADTDPLIDETSNGYWADLVFWPESRDAEPSTLDLGNTFNFAP